MDHPYTVKNATLYQRDITIYTTRGERYFDVPGSPCHSQTGPVVGPSFSIFSGFRPPVKPLAPLAIFGSQTLFPEELLREGVHDLQGKNLSGRF